MRRPDVFTLDYSHPLAQGLVFGGLGQMPGSAKFNDASLVKNHGNSGSAVWGSNLGKPWLTQNGTSEYITLLLNYANFTTWTFSIWTDWQTRVGEENALLGGGGLAPGTPYLETPSVNNFRVRILAGTDHGYVYLTAGSTASDWSYVWNQAKIRGVRNYTIVKTPTTAEFYIDGISQGQKANAGQFYFNQLVSFGGNTDGTYPYGGKLADPCLFNRALSPAEIALLADRTDPMLGGLIVEERPVLWFDMGGGAVDDLTAQDLVIGSPILGSPSLGQVHALTALSLAVGSPVVGSPALVQDHAFTASGLITASPVLGSPALVEDAPNSDNLTALDLAVGSPALGAPSLSQIHVLGSDGLIVGSPDLGAPTFYAFDVGQITDAEIMGRVIAARRRTSIIASKRKVLVNA